ncbi:Hypothetical protein, putative, partial [Bodo saltans]
DKGAIAAVENEIEEARARMVEALAVVDMKVRFPEARRLWLNIRLVMHSRLPAECPRWSEEEWMAHIMKWSEDNSRRGITGILMTTGVVHFCVFEGAQSAVQELFLKVSKDATHKDCTMLSLGKIETRDYVFGLKLHYITDDIMATVLQRAQTDIILSSSFAPQVARDVVVRGGDAEGIVPDHRPESIAVAVLLDALVGAHHSAQSYKAATTMIEDIVYPQLGVVVERFGEAMVIVFPWPQATQAFTCTKMILEQVPHSIAAIATGSCTFVSAPYCWAFGTAIINAKDLLYIAQRERRRLIVTEAASDRCSKAHHRFLSITVDAHVYFTLQSLAEGRLGLEDDPTEGDIVIPAVGMTPVIVPTSNVTTFRHMTHAELVEKSQAAAVVRGALTKEKIQEYYRQLDPANAGWVGKDTVVRWIKSGNSPYQLFEPHEETQLPCTNSFVLRYPSFNNLKLLKPSDTASYLVAIADCK